MRFDFAKKGYSRWSLREKLHLKRLIYKLLGLFAVSIYKMPNGLTRKREP